MSLLLPESNSNYYFPRCWNENLFDRESNTDVHILGDQGVGKTTLYNKHLEINSKIIVNGRAVELVIHESRTDEINLPLARKVLPILLVYDITNQESFNNAKSLYNEIKNNSLLYRVILVGNKQDLSRRGRDNGRKVDFVEVDRFARDNGIGAIETSANLGKKGENVEYLFQTVARIALNAFQRPEEIREMRASISKDLNANLRHVIGWSVGAFLVLSAAGLFFAIGLRAIDTQGLTSTGKKMFVAGGITVLVGVCLSVGSVWYGVQRHQFKKAVKNFNEGNYPAD